MGANGRELEALEADLERREIGVTDLMELYEKVESIYVQASSSVPESEVVRVSDSTS